MKMSAALTGLSMLIVGLLSPDETAASPFCSYQAMIEGKGLPTLIVPDGRIAAAPRAGDKGLADAELANAVLQCARVAFSGGEQSSIEVHCRNAARPEAAARSNTPVRARIKVSGPDLTHPKAEVKATLCRHFKSVKRATGPAQTVHTIPEFRLVLRLTAGGGTRCPEVLKTLGPETLTLDCAASDSRDVGWRWRVQPPAAKARPVKAQPASRPAPEKNTPPTK